VIGSEHLVRCSSKTRAAAAIGNDRAERPAAADVAADGEESARRFNDWRVAVLDIMPPKLDGLPPLDARAIASQPRARATAKDTVQCPVVYRLRRRLSGEAVRAWTSSWRAALCRRLTA
jgi:hypothetical protein